MNNPQQNIARILDELTESLASVKPESLNRLATAVMQTHRRGGKVYGAAAGRMLLSQIPAYSIVTREISHGICLRDRSVPKFISGYCKSWRFDYVMNKSVCLG